MDSVSPSRDICSEATDPKAMHLKLPFPCDRPSCDRRFARKAILVDHLNKHDNKKPYVCPNLPCLMTFTRKSDMRRHYAKHTGSGEVVCPDCEHRFSRKDAYRKHDCVVPRNPKESRKNFIPNEAAVVDECVSSITEEQQLCDEKWLPLLWSFSDDVHDMSNGQLLAFPDELNIPLTGPVLPYATPQTSLQSKSDNDNHFISSRAAPLPEISMPSVVPITSSEAVQISWPRTKRTALRTTAPRPIPMASKKYGLHLECFLCVESMWN